MLTKYGTDNIIIMLAAGIILIVLGIIVSKTWLEVILLTPGILLILFTLWFFRDPDRTIPRAARDSEAVVLSPADGKVVEIKDIFEDVYLKTDAVQISIFLSPLDVHVNRSPVSGIVEYFKYHPGKYLVAYHPKSSMKNEQTHIGVKNGVGKVFFKQIVGIVARRLVWDIKEGDTLAAGQRFGMMKFGSRMDVILSRDSKINVNVGDKVTAGETILAEMDSTGFKQ